MAEPLLIVPTIMADARPYMHIVNSQIAHRPVQISAPLGGTSIGSVASRCLAQAPGEFSILGHGLGALVAMQIVLQAPERVKRLILMGGSGQSELPAVAATYEALLIKAQTGALGAAISELTGIDAMANSADRDQLESLVLDMAFDLGTAMFTEQLRLLQRRPDVQSSLRKITCPTLIMGGDKDPIFPARHLDFMANIMPDAQAHVIKGAGAWLPVEAPNKCAEMISDFLPKPLLLG